MGRKRVRARAPKVAMPVLSHPTMPRTILAHSAACYGAQGNPDGRGVTEERGIPGRSWARRANLEPQLLESNKGNCDRTKVFRGQRLKRARSQIT